MDLRIPTTLFFRSRKCLNGFSPVELSFSLRSTQASGHFLGVNVMPSKRFDHVIFSWEITVDQPQLTQMIIQRK